jgi:NAD(P)-dependent dehydrogenase (short-subunit alcohol dehydrogenase family)
VSARHEPDCASSPAAAPASAGRSARPCSTKAAASSRSTARRQASRIRGSRRSRSISPTATRRGRIAAEVAARTRRRRWCTTPASIRPALLADVKLDDLDALVELHLGAAITLVQAVLPAMRAARFGRIVLISSRAALGAATRTAYSATKAALLGLARTWALELAADGITVNVVAPGPIRTDMYHAIVPPGSEQDRRLAASIPVGRIGEADDVARAVAFFAAPANGFVTGQTLFVCGGSSVSSLKV